MTNDQARLQAHLENLNRKSEAWVAEDPKNRWSSIYITDINHWAKEGIFSPEDHTHHALVTEAFELTRSFFGYKPSWTGLNSMTDDELRKEIKLLSDGLNRQFEAEQAEELAHENAVKMAMTVHSGFSIGELVSL